MPWLPPQRRRAGKEFRLTIRPGDETVAALRSFLPPEASTRNPVDLAGGGEQDFSSFERVARLCRTFRASARSSASPSAVWEAESYLALYERLR